MTNERAYTPSLVLHVLRNPHGWSVEAITAARLQAADEIERLRDALKRVRRVAAEGTTHTGMISALGILVDRALNPGNGPLPPDYTYHSHEPCEQRCDCLERISALIVKGPLEGDGWDPTAQRNGIILAANHIASFNRPAPQGASRDLSASESASFHKTLARSPRRIGAGIPPDGAPSMPEGASRDASSEPAKCSFCGETKIHGQNCGYFGQPVRTSEQR